MIQAMPALLLPLSPWQDSTGDTPAPGGLGDFLLPMILIVGIFYVVLFLPERKKQKKRKEMLATMKKGDKVMTSSGLYASVAQVQDDVIVLQVADGVRLRFSRSAIQNVLTEEPAEKD